MIKQKHVADDIRAVRDKSGLRQVDCAHLLGVSSDRISDIETGKGRPTVLEIATLSIVFGKPMESLLSALLDEVADGLIERLRTMPSVSSRSLADTLIRTETLRDLVKRLEMLTISSHEGA
jgi:transcriptional regulator with XRE-family HTH domain